MSSEFTNNENSNETDEKNLVESSINPQVNENTVSEEKNDVNGKPKKGWKRELIEWIESLGIAVVVALLITNFIFTMVIVDGASMEPTLHNKNQLFVFRLGYEPENGDIVVFKPQGETKKHYIKRVIAVEGQTVDIKDGYVYVDGNKLEENYVADLIRTNVSGKYPKTVPKDSVFVLGDNRNNSRDSRDETTVGMVSEKSIVGKALFRVLPFNQMGGLYSNYNLK